MTSQLHQAFKLSSGLGRAGILNTDDPRSTNYKMAATLPEGSVVSTANRLLYGVIQSPFIKVSSCFCKHHKIRGEVAVFTTGGGQEYKENLHNYSSLAAPHQTSVIVMATTSQAWTCLSFPLFTFYNIPPAPQTQNWENISMRLPSAPLPHLDRSTPQSSLRLLGALNKAEQNAYAGEHSIFSSISELV